MPSAQLRGSMLGAVFSLKNTTQGSGCKCGTVAAFDTGVLVRQLIFAFCRVVFISIVYSGSIVFVREAGNNFCMIL